MIRALVIASLGASLLAGCGEVTVTALTPPPPGKVATLDAEDGTLELSRGVAFAFECNANTDYYGPCRDATAKSTDEAIASVFPSYLDSLGSAYEGGDLGPRSRSSFVVVGLGAGKAKIAVTTSDGDVEIDVSVKD